MSKLGHQQLKLVVLLLSISLITNCQPSFKDCNFTDYTFQSQYNLGRQDELTNTFNQMSGNIKLKDIVYASNSFTNYTIQPVNLVFQYYDSKQKAEIMGNDTIVIDGGYVQVTVDFNWKKKDFFQVSGTGKASCKSNQIIFSKNLSIQEGFVVYKVQQYYNISFSQKRCTLLRYDPATTSQSDIGILTQMLSSLASPQDTILSQLTQQLSINYLKYLQKNLYDQKHKLDDTMIYQWSKDGKDKLIIQYQIVPTGVDLEKQGLSFTYLTEIRNYNNWECGAIVPHQNLNPKTFGGVQEFTSLSVFKNTLYYAIEKGVLDTALNKQNWQSKMFQFFAGDLYQVIPSIAQKYYARDIVSGNCICLQQYLSITAQQLLNQLNVRTTFTCRLSINNTPIINIDIDLHTLVQSRFQQQSKVNFYIKDYSFGVSYREQSSFKIKYQQLANQILKSSLDNLKGMKVFGSGWKTFKMDYPHMKVMAPGYVVFYDTANIATSQI